MNLTKSECVWHARLSNHQALEFLHRGKPSVARYFRRQRDTFMRIARKAGV